MTVSQNSVSKTAATRPCCGDRAAKHASSISSVYWRLRWRGSRASRAC